MGRRLRIARIARICPLCPSMHVGDARHCVFECPQAAFEDIRHGFQHIFVSHGAMRLLIWYPRQKDVALCLLQLPDGISERWNSDMNIPLCSISPAGCVTGIQHTHSLSLSLSHALIWRYLRWSTMHGRFPHYVWAASPAHANCLDDWRCRFLFMYLMPTGRLAERCREDRAASYEWTAIETGQIRQDVAEQTLAGHVVYKCVCSGPFWP